MLNLKYKGPELRKLLKMAQIRQALILSKTWKGSVPVYSRILGQIFFSVIKKIWWHRWHSGQNRLKVLVLANNRCATALNYGGTAWHKWRIYWLFCKYVVAQMYSARATLFGFLKTFLPKYSPIEYITRYETS